MSVWVDPVYERLQAEAFSAAMREALATPDDHESIAAALWKIAGDSHLDLSHEQRSVLSNAARIVKFAPVKPPMLVKNADGTFSPNYDR